MIGLLQWIMNIISGLSSLQITNYFYNQNNQARYSFTLVGILNLLEIRLHLNGIRFGFYVAIYFKVTYFLKMRFMIQDCNDCQDPKVVRARVGGRKNKVISISNSILYLLG